MTSSSVELPSYLLAPDGMEYGEVLHAPQIRFLTENPFVMNTVVFRGNMPFALKRHMVVKTLNYHPHAMLSTISYFELTIRHEDLHEDLHEWTHMDVYLEKVYFFRITSILSDYSFFWRKKRLHNT